MAVDQLKSGAWRARFRGPDGRFISKSFKKDHPGGAKRAAQRWEREERARLDRDGEAYVDHRAGRLTFREWSERWQAGHVCSPATAQKVASILRAHLLPAFGDRPLGAVRRSEVQRFVRDLSETHAPATVALIYGYLSTIFKAAVLDRLLVESPCREVRLPTVETRKVVPLTPEQVEALVSELPERYRGLVLLVAGMGLRQGEALGLTVEHVDFLRRRLRVEQQLTFVGGPLRLTDRLKTKASRREVPMPQSIVDALAAHLAAFPVMHPDGLLFVNDAGDGIRRTRFAETVWTPAVKRAGLPQGTGFHGLRHFYASLLIRHGESVKVVQERLGHKSAQETLDTYSHLWPDSEDRTRAAVDAVLGGFRVTGVSRGTGADRPQAL